MTGTIKRINGEKGYGFISQEGQSGDLFFHKTGVSGGSFEELKEGDTVNFEIEEAKPGSKGPAAINVSKA
jgi:cold shock protein